MAVLIFSPLPELEQPAPKYIRFVQNNYAVTNPFLGDLGCLQGVWALIYGPG